MNPFVSVPKAAGINVSCTKIPDVSLGFFHVTSVHSNSAGFHLVQRSLLPCYLLVELSIAEVAAVVILEVLLELA